MDLLFDPTSEHWSALLIPPDGEFLGASQHEWRQRTRSELALDTARPIIATGHQTLLWHPGILAKYLAMVAYAEAHGLAMANLIVDQHADRFGSFEVPILGFNDSLATREFVLATPRKGVPMGLHEPFTPPKAPTNWRAAIESVEVGGQAIFDAVYAHRDASSAAMQMAAALADLMQRWIPPLPKVTSSQLMTTSLARSMLQRMADDPWTCAAHYNKAVRANPDAGITELLIRDDYVELPLWRIRPDGTRMRAYDNDVQRWLESSTINGGCPQPHEHGRDQRHESGGAPEHGDFILLPRALFLTALVRLGMADLFIHGTGGGVYDRAMEQWVQSWLGATPSSIAVVSATVCLPLLEGVSDILDPAPARHQARRIWHDPAQVDSDSDSIISPRKQAWLDRIDSLPRRSPERRAAFLTMHRELAALRSEHKAAIEAAKHHARHAAARVAAEQIANRRDWPFPLYPVGMIDGLREAIKKSIAGPLLMR